MHVLFFVFGYRSCLSEVTLHLIVELKDSHIVPICDVPGPWRVLHLPVFFGPFCCFLLSALGSTFLIFLPLFPSLCSREEASMEEDFTLIAHDGRERASRMRILYPCTARTRSSADRCSWSECATRIDPGP